MPNRSIVHLDLDTFFVSCERLIDGRLVGKPVLVGGTSGRGVVAACSYEARTYGIHSAMPMAVAKQLCPEAIIIRGNSGTYSKFSDMVTEIIKEESPLFEKSSIDEFYIDVSGMDKFFGCYQWAKKLRNRIRHETGLPLSFGLSTNKTVSKITTGIAKPDNHKEILMGHEKAFLAPLSVKKIPMIGNQTYALLRSMGIEQIKTLQEMPIQLLFQVLGKNGTSIWKKANGIDNSPVIPFHERQSISSSITFEKDSIDIQKMKDIISTMAEKLSYYLRIGKKLTSCITVTVRYSDFQTTSRQCKIIHTSCDHILMKKTLELFDALYNRRVLVRLVGVRFSSLTSGGHQINAFEDSEEMINLYQAMDKIRTRFGQDAIKRGVTMNTSGIGQFANPFNGQPPVIPAHRRL